jgi:hypothetical protein
MEYSFRYRGMNHAFREILDAGKMAIHGIRG